MKATAAARRRGHGWLAAAWVVCCLAGGFVVSVVVAWWSTRINWPQITAVWRCIHAWRQEGGVIGVEMAWQYEGWVPVERSSLYSVRGYIVQRAGDDPDRPDETGPYVRFTEGDTYAAGMDADAVHAGPPAWFLEGARAFNRTDAYAGERRAAGWPCICLEGFTLLSGKGQEKPSIWYWWTTKGPEFGEHFPLRPVWPGLAVNTVVWGGALWCAVAGARLGWRAVVERVRVKPGLCRACGYDRRGLSAGTPCPECGKGRGQ